MSTKLLKSSYKIGARGSKLSQAQCAEILRELRLFADVDFEPVWISTTGDLDRTTSLRTLGKTDFFTREIDDLLLSGGCRFAIHSAKDLPEPLREGLTIAALTRGLDSSDSLVYRGDLPPNAKIATSSPRREKAIEELRIDLVCVDIRGNIDERLHKLETGEIDGLVVAECALIRLGLTHLNRIKLPGPGAEGQGRLAVVVRSDDTEMVELFRPLDSR